MSLSIISPLPDPTAKLRELTEENSRLRDQIDDLESQLRKERRKGEAVEKGAGELKKILEPLYQGLGMIFGQIEAMGVSAASAASVSGTDPRKTAAWEDWKRKLGGQAAKAIDALLLHGALTQSQIRFHVGCATGSTAGIVYQLNKAGLINKNGGRISLKEL